MTALELERLLNQQIDLIYGNFCSELHRADLAGELMRIMKLNRYYTVPEPETNKWNERDVVLITYGDSICSANRTPLQTLYQFLNRYCNGTVNSVHILPFFPYSSDDGFSVIDYREVNESLGDWNDIVRISGDYRLMADLVINHCSSESEWFQNFLAGAGHGHDFIMTASETDDLTMVVRPRTSPLLHTVETHRGAQSVWCTFSHDQVDLDFRNPSVLLEFAAIIRYYLDRGVRLFRLDAIAFLWKEPSTSCINLPQTHLVVRLLRTLIEFAQPDAVVITETNIPVRENLSYFGEANEANWVYNFPLPPLLLNTLVTGDCRHLRRWLMSMPPAYNGTAFFNFIASHDGIGLRPVEGILSEEEVDTLAACMSRFGGKISWRTVSDTERRPYELNISLYDALQGTIDGPDRYNQARFLCAHAIMLGLEGIPGIYIHSLLATGNAYEKLAHTGHNRSINRGQWNLADLEAELQNTDSPHSQVLNALLALLAIRVRQPALHPNATQFTLQLPDELLGFWRQSLNRRQSIFCISNVTNAPRVLSLAAINLIDHQPWTDLITATGVDTSAPTLTLAPYQTVWISNYL